MACLFVLVQVGHPLRTALRASVGNGFHLHFIRYRGSAHGLGIQYHPASHTPGKVEQQ